VLHRGKQVYVQGAFEPKLQKTPFSKPPFGCVMRALMTNIPQVNIWVETGAFFDSITDADIAFRMVAGDGGGRVRTQHARPAPRGGGAPHDPARDAHPVRLRAVPCPRAVTRRASRVGRQVIDERARPWSGRSPRAFR